MPIVSHQKLPGVAEVLDLLDVHPGTEAPTLGPDDHHPVVGNTPRGEDRLGQGVPARHVEGVDRGMVDDHLGDAGSGLMDGDGHATLRDVI